MVPLPFPLERLDETLAIYDQMCSDDEGPFEGKHYQLARTLNSPQPLSGRPPVMIGGMGPNKTLRLAARYAQAVNWFPIGTGAFQGLKATLAKHCETEGTDVDDAVEPHPDTSTASTPTRPANTPRA